MNFKQLRRRKKTLRTRAHQAISICCETLCDKEVVLEYITELEDKIEAYEQGEEPDSPDELQDGWWHCDDNL
jgi:DNA-dependent RNA polymerase auxiliary subunit epsilon